MPPTLQPHEFNTILAWVASIIEPCETVTRDPRYHDRTSVLRLRTPERYYYLKLHQQASTWETEVHDYEQWAPVFAEFAPKLLGTHESEPLALLVGELPGQILDNVSLPARQELEVWHNAGQALRDLHEHTQGTFFGPCRRNGESAGDAITDAQFYISAEFDRWLKTARRRNLLNEKESTVIRLIQDQIPVFAGEPPVPCHRDYGPANWVVAESGEWTGVIDFEFAHWDVRVNDFSRYPNWEWIRRPELLQAFFQGYGRPLTAIEEKQCLVSRTLYALGAIVWGNENAFYGYEAEGRQALEHIIQLVM